MPLFKTTRYPIGELRIENVELDQRTANNPGSILIGGDLCDIWASDATQDGADVILHGTEFRSGATWSGTPENICDTIVNLARDTVENSYRDIQRDTFRKSKKHD